MKVRAKKHTKDLSTSKSTKLADERLWSMCLLFLDDEQSLQFSHKTSKFLATDTGSKKNPTTNLLLPMYRNVAARLSTAYPNIIVLPASPSTEDIIKATTSETAARYYWRQVRMKARIAKAVEWLLTAGTTAFHTYYDGNDVRTQTVSPYDLFFEPGAEDPEESDYISVRSYYTREGLHDLYPKLADEISKLPLVDPADSRTLGRPYSSYQGKPSRIEVYETYWRDGTHAVTSNHLTLFEGETKLPSIPIEVIRYTTLPRKLWGKSLIAPLLDTQWLYNKFRNLVLQNVEIMGNPIWVISRSAGATTITNKPGQIVYYNNTARRPEQIPGAPLPQYVMDNIAKLQSEIQDQGGVHAVSLGKRATGVHSGAAIDALSARDSSQLQVTQSSIEEACEGVARTALILMQQHYKEKKMMRMMDSFGRVIFKELRKTDLYEEPEVFIQSGSLFRDEAQDRDAKILDYVQRGLLDKEEARKEISLHTGGTAYLKEVADLAHAHEILEAMKEGHEIEVFKNDPLKAFIEVIGEYMRTEDYRELPEETALYIRDAYVAISAAGDPKQAAEETAKFKVFPLSAPGYGDPQQQGVAVVAPESAGGEAQQAEEVMAGQRDKMEAKQAESLFKAMQPEMENNPDGPQPDGALKGGMGV